MNGQVRRKPGRQRLNSNVVVPAPIGGLNTVNVGSDMPPLDCVQLYNMIAAEYGLRSRLGHREWCTGLEGVDDNLVRSTIAFTGSDSSEDRVFATTSAGIYDVTDSIASPTLVHAFGITTGEAGYGVEHVVVTASGGHFLLYADEENGLLYYEESTGLWDEVSGAQITGVNPASVAFVGVFKSRVWLGIRGSSTAYYLPAGAVFGAATSFAMGTKFKHGGSLVGFWNWSYDGGAGIDDSLVVVSGGGDILVWQMSDPATPTNTYLKGVWYTGGVPYGRRIATDFGGDLLIQTRTGLLSMSTLVLGKTLASNQYETAKIANLVNALMLTKSQLHGWSIQLHPEDNALIVTVPEAEGYATTQLAMSLTTRGWSRYRDLPIFSSAVLRGKLYFGTADGRVCINDGYIDGLLLSDELAFSPVHWACLTGFNRLGTSQLKRIQSLAPTILSDGAEAAFNIEARYNFDLTELAAVSPNSGGGNSVWGTGLWGEALWAGEYAAARRVRGATGEGYTVAAAIRGAAICRVVLVDIDVGFEVGGTR